MQKSQIHKASSLLTKHEALVINIRYLRDMAERIVTGRTYRHRQHESTGSGSPV